MGTKKNVVAGVDLGGTHTKIGIVDRDMNFYGDKVINTNMNSFNQWVQDVSTCIKDICKNNQDIVLAGLGLGAPNANPFTKCIESPANLQSWANTENKGILDVKATFEKYLGIKTIALDNDANAAAFGEKCYGGAKKMKDFIVITLGTGLGAGIYIHDQLVYGYTGIAGELGHVIVEKGGRFCGCRRRGCLETYCSATGVARTMLELMADDRSIDTPLRNVEPNKMSSRLIYEEALKGCELSKRCFDVTGEILGRALADFTCFSSPEAFFITGGLARSGDLILNPTIASFEANLCFPYKGKVKVALSEIMNKNPAILGAAALAWNELDK